MAILLVKASVEETLQAAEDFLASINAKNAVKKAINHGCPESRIKAQAGIDKFDIDFSFRFSRSNNDTLVSSEALPSRNKQRGLLIKICIFIFLVLQCFRLFQDSLSNKIVYFSDMILFFGALFFMALMVRKDITVFSNRLKLAENRSLMFLRNKFDVKLLSPVEASFLPLNVSLLINGIMTFLCLAFMYQFKALFIVVTAFLIVHYLHGCLRKIVRRDVYLFWRMKVIEVNFKWLNASLFIILSFFALYFLNSAIFVRYVNSVEPGSYSLKQIINPIYFKPALDRSLDNIEHSNVEMVKRTISNEMKKSSRMIYRHAILFIASIFIAAMALSLWLLSSNYRALIKIPEDWKATIGKEEVTNIRAPVVSATQSRGGKLYKSVVLLDYLIAIPVTYSATVICVDAMCYALSGKTLILEKAAILFSWIPANFMILAEALKIEHQGLFIILSKAYLLALSLPVILLVGRRVTKIVANAYVRLKRRRFRLDSKRQVPANIQNNIDKISGECNLGKAKIRIMKSTLIESSVKCGLFSKTPKIYLSNEALEKLDANEIMALVTHELGHVKQGLRKLFLAKILSRISLLPNYFLTALFDFVAMEYEADRFCVRATEDKEALKNALIKTILLNQALRKEALKGRNGKTRLMKISKFYYKLLATDEFFFGDILLGYSQPVLAQRIKRIESL